MIVKTWVREDYKQFIETDPSVPTELRIALKSNERVPVFIDNAAREIEKAADYLARKGKKIDRAKVKYLVHQLCQQFVHFQKVKADENYQSQLAREATKVKLEGDELIKKLDDDGNADFSDELGVQIVDNQQRSVGTD